MNTVDKLLKIDLGKIKRNESVYKMHLSRINQAIEFQLVEVDAEYVAELQEESMELNVDGDLKIRTFAQKVFTIIEGCPSVFKNQELISHFKCQTPKDLVKTLLAAGEIDELFGEIQELNGYDNKKDKDEVKN